MTCSRESTAPSEIAKPTFDPPGGTYSTSVSVTITCATSGAEIRYSTDGSDPTEASILYSDPITVSAFTNLKARGFKSGWDPSPVASATYQVTAQPTGMAYVDGGSFVTLVLYDITATVTLSSFWIGTHEVRQSEYEAVMGVNPSDYVGPDKAVEHVSWMNAIEYCNRRSLLEGMTPCYSYGDYGTDPDSWPAGWDTGFGNHLNVSCDWEASGYRLPTEHQWWFAARGGNFNQGYTYSGSNNASAVAWHAGNTWDLGPGHPDFGTHDVGLKAPNELLTYDMSGNVLEYCWDIHGGLIFQDQTDPTGYWTTGEYRVVRGGSWLQTSPACRVDWRDGFVPHSIGMNGFRVSRSANPRY
ncbi:MAG: SUMF1/EgtB/PvdO family nonheme iron enzyme [Candidatus Syntrophosphaera sp.]|nr:SUMF1/EgtB/PvdO family nonheme iron enzyme [Candidatus Syntrophosphaera sp.]